MATPIEALFSACLGLVGGILGAGVVERLKAGAASLETELIRLESLEDEIFDVFEVPADDAGRSIALRNLAGRRRRLGKNIRRKVPDSAAYGACKSQLVRLDRILAQAEDAIPLTDEIETDIETTISILRNRLRRSSRTARVFAMLRGDS